MCLKFFKKKFKKKIKKKKIKKKSESYLKASPPSSPILSINGISINRFEKDIYNNRNFETNPLMELLSDSLSPPHFATIFPELPDPPKNYEEEYLISPGLSKYEIGDYDSSSEEYFPEPEIKIK
jgi:hypothetical protein